MGAQKRCKHEIIAQILDTCMDGDLYTHIMQKVVLSGELTTRYLKFLTANGFLEIINSKHRIVFKTTPKGVALRQALENVANFKAQ